MVQSCPLCRSVELSILAEIHSKTYWRCEECCLAFLSPEYRLDASQERSRYLLHQNDPKDLRYRSFLSRLTDHLLPKLHPGASGLDYGSGPGPTLSVMLKEQGFLMHDYDPFFSPETRPLQYQYDFVTCTETIEHFYYPDKQFQKLDQLMKKGGWLGIMTETFISDERFLKWHYHRDPTHVCFYKRETLAWIASKFEWRMEYPSKNIVLYQKQAMEKVLS